MMGAETKKKFVAAIEDNRNITLNTLLSPEFNPKGYSEYQLPSVLHEEGFSKVNAATTLKMTEANREARVEFCEQMTQ